VREVKSGCCVQKSGGGGLKFSLCVCCWEWVGK